MSFAALLIKDLKKRNARIQSCGYYKLDVDKKAVVLQSGEKYDLNINFGGGIPKDEVKGNCDIVEIEVFGGVPEVYNYDVTFFYRRNGRLVVKFYSSLTNKNKKSLKEYLKEFGLKEIIFERV